MIQLQNLYNIKVNVTLLMSVKLLSLIPPTHHKRIGWNHLTQIKMPYFSREEYSASLPHEVFCWIMTKDSLFEEFDVRDGTLLHRFVMALFFFSQNQTFDFDSFSPEHTCDWPGIKCDSNKKIVEHIDLPNSGLGGTLITEIGLLTRLQKINFSGNDLGGSIDSLLFSYMLDLEVFDVGGNNMEGEIPKESF